MTAQPMPMTPVEVEDRLVRLDLALEEAFKELDEAEYEYHQTKVDLELGLAAARMALAGTGKMTVQEKEDRALVANEEQARTMAVVDARVKAARANIAKLRTQADIVRSIGAGLRTSMDLA